MSVRLTCVNKVRNNNNVIQAYQLREINNGTLHELTTDKLKNGIRSRRYVVNNLKLTSDGRLIDNDTNSNTDSIIMQYMEACDILGIKPLKIENINNLYIVTDIPDGETTVNIPEFVNAIAVKKRLNTYNGTSPVATSKPGNIKMSNEDIEKYLKEILRKASSIEDRALLIYNNQVNNNLDSKLNELKSSIDTLGNKFDGLGNYLQHNGQSIIDITDKARPLFHNMIDTIISDENAFKVTDSAVTDEELCSFNGDLYCLNHSILQSPHEYEAIVSKYTPRYTSFEDVVKLEQYVNYAYNTFISTYNALTREGGICKTLSARDQLGYLDAVAGLSGCIMSLATAPFTGGVAALAGMIAGANNIPKDVAEAGRNFSSSFDAKDNKRKAEILLKRNFSKAVQDIDDMNQYIDKFIYLVALQYILSTNTSRIDDLNRSGFCDRIILRTIKALDNNPSINVDEIEKQVLTSYIAATLYVKYNYHLEDDFSEAEIITEMSKSASHVSAKIRRRQSYFYALIEKWMEAALHCMYIHPDVIYNTIRTEFREQGKLIGIHLEHIEKDILQNNKTINIGRIVNKEFIESHRI